MHIYFSVAVLEISSLTIPGRIPTLKKYTTTDARKTKFIESVSRQTLGAFVNVFNFDTLMNVLYFLTVKKKF